MAKKVRVTTFCTETSIGSILQSYALSKYLEEHSYETAVLQEKCDLVERNPKIPSSLKDLLRRIYRIPQKGKIHRAQKKRARFIASHIAVEYYQDENALKQQALKNEDYVYLAGSDQIWHPDRCDPVFFLSFAGNNKRISYAASMGKTEIPLQNKEKISQWLKAFDAISVREKDCVLSLQELTKQEMSTHVDPTFLMSSQSWRELEKPYEVKGPYILLYMLYWDNACKKQIIALKKRTGLPVYAICPDVSRVYADKRLYDVGVEEFLWLVDHAKYVITSSFHGVAFSILFQKQFSAVINPSLSSRIRNVMDVLSVPTVSIEQLDTAKAFPYEEIAANIEKERQRSMEYLIEAIG